MQGASMQFHLCIAQNFATETPRAEQRQRGHFEMMQNRSWHIYGFMESAVGHDHTQVQDLKRRLRNKYASSA